MRIVVSPPARMDYLRWLDADESMTRRINELIRDVRRSPFRGIGKPEPLRNDLAGFWSRRITTEHRLIDRISGRGDDQALEIASCRFHYSNR